MKSHRLVFVIAICLFIALVSFAQDKQKNKDESPVNVNLNVYALDSSGKPVDNLKTKDFKIFEDGIEQKINYFVEKEHILNAVVVGDNTGSTRPYLNKIIFVGSTIADNLRSNDEASVIRFVSSDKIEKLQDWTSNAGLLKSAIQNMYPEGGRSAIIDALYLAAQEALEREKTNKTKRYAIILISDGEDLDSYYKLKQLFDLLKGSDVQIFPFSIIGGQENGKTGKAANNFLNLLALKTGGTSFLLKKSDEKEITEALKELVAELRSQYIIGYTSTNPKHDGVERKLTLNITNDAKGEKRLGFLRESFVVPEDKK